MARHGEEGDSSLAEPDFSGGGGLDPTDHRILKLKLCNRNLSTADISQIVGLSKQAIWKRTKKPTFARLWAELEKDAVARWKETYSEAVTVMQTLLRSEDERIRFMAAREIMEPMKQSSYLLPDQLSTATLQFIDPDEAKDE